MTPFLRKIRKKLLDEGRLKRYLIYAFGEILLVVAGILIALQINNWNEARKAEADLNNILLIIRQDMENDLQEAKEIRALYEAKSNTIDTLLHHSPSKDYVKNCTLCIGITTGYSTVPFNTRGYDLLKNQIETTSAVNDSLLLDIDDFYRQLTLVSDLVGEALRDETFKSLEHMRQYPNWFIDFLEGRRPDGLIDYVLNNQTHHIQMAFYQMLVKNNFLPFLDSFERSAEELTARINERLGLNN